MAFVSHFDNLFSNDIGMTTLSPRSKTPFTTDNSSATFLCCLNLISTKALNGGGG